jgi:TetR/AcrR family transcriptional regulator
VSITSRKEREKEQRRKDILEAAEKLFFARGYDSVTMDDIAREVELNKATIYLYFYDKESLYFTVVLRGVQILRDMVKEYEDRAKSGFDKLWEIGHAYVSFAKKYPDYNRTYNYFYSGRFDLANVKDDTITCNPYDTSAGFWKNVDVSASWASKEVARLVVEMNQEIFALMAGAIRSGIDEGAFRKDLDPEEAAIVFTLLLESVPRMRPDLVRVLEEKGTDRTQFSRDIGELIGHMLKDKPAALRKGR